SHTIVLSTHLPLFFLTLPRTPTSTLFPYTTLFRSELPLGLGARHAAAAAITVETRAISISVSQSSGSVRVFKDGEAVLELQQVRSEEHTSELQSRENLVCRLLLEKKKKKKIRQNVL